MTPDDRLEYQRKWRQSPAGKASALKYRNSEKGKASRERYNAGATERMRAYRATPEGREASRAAMRRYFASEKGKAAQRRDAERNGLSRSRRRRYSRLNLLRKCQQRARKASVECTLTIDDVESLIAPMRCEVTGMALSWGDGTPKFLMSPSLDRKDPTKGYVLGNVQCVALWVNLGRNDQPLDDFKAILSDFAASAGKRPIPERDEWPDQTAEASALEAPSSSQERPALT